MNGEDKDLTLTYGDQTMKPTVIEQSDSRELGPVVHIHKFRVKDLKAGTAYPYKVANFESKFRTAPADQAGEVLFIFGGDYTMPNDALVKKVEDDLKKEVDFFVDLGDHLISRRLWIKNLAWVGRTPILFGKGNHDNEVGKYTKDKTQAQKYMDFPDPASLDFSYEWGPVMFRVENVPGYAKPYPQSDLDAIDKAYAETKCAWKFYGCHHVFFSDGPHGNQAFPVDGKDRFEGELRRQQLWPIFKKHNVRTVLNGHDHLYQRTAFINGEGKPDPAGTMNIIFGGDHTTFKSKSPWSEHQYMGKKAGIAYMHIKGENASMKMIDKDGVVADQIDFKLK
jgi:hypothetical protein